MTENQPQPPESEQPQSETPVSQPLAGQPLPPQKPLLLKTLTIKTLRGTIQLLETAVEKLEAPPPAQLQPSLLDKLRPGLINIWNGWVAVLGNIRPLLPESLNQKLSNWGLTGAIASILALIVWTTSTLSQKPAEVATAPPSGTPTPPELTAPAQPQPVESFPEVERVLTPEQRLIASIQEQVAEVTTQYAEGLIQSIQANFSGSFLLVNISDEWYNLKESRQNKLAAEMLQRANELDFSKLDIIDSRGTAIARSPVIGSEMIILNRRLKAET